MRGEVVRLKYVAGINQRSLAEDTDEDYEFVYVDIGSVTTGHMQLSDSNIKFGDAPSRARRLADSGDTVISTVRTYLKAVAEVPSVDEAELVFSTGFAVVHPHTNITDSRYLSYAMQADSFTQAVEAHSVGVSYPAVNASDVGNVRIWLPDVGEQRIIAEFLDRETAQIDAMIDAQQRLVDLLAERRSATLTGFFSGTLGEFGVPPQVERPSGERSVRAEDFSSSWLQSLPQGWRVTKVRALVEEIDKRNTDSAIQDYLSLVAGRGVIPYAEKGDLGNKKPEDLSKCKIVEPGDLVINSMNYTIGSYGTSDYFGVCSPVYIVLRPRPEVMNVDLAAKFFAATGFQKIAQEYGNGILPHRRSIGWDTLKNLPVYLPPLDVQAELNGMLEARLSSTKRLIDHAKEVIALLRERRAAVITAAVTGRLDPRTGVERVEEMLEGAAL